MISSYSISELVLVAFAVLVTLTVHEYAHGYMAYKLGDNTAKARGRLTLNPIQHIDPVGALCMLFFGFGWAKPVPINPRNFKNYKRGFALTALAGPVSNFILAFLSAGVYLLIFALVKDTAFESDFAYKLIVNLLKFFSVFHSVNVGIALFNLIPIPPLDGSRILNVILPPKTYFAIMKHERTIYYVLLGWLLIGEFVVTFLLSIPIIYYNPILSSIVRIFSLSDILGFLISKVSSFIFYLWELIPFLKV